MNRLLAALIAAAFGVVSAAAVAQGTTGMQQKDSKGAGAAYANPAAEKTAAEKAKEASMAVQKSKGDPRTRSKFDEQTAQALSRTSTDPAQAKANVSASKAQSPKRTRMPDIKSMTPEERAQLRRELDKLATP